MGLRNNRFRQVGRGRSSIASALAVAMAITVGVLWSVSEPSVVLALGTFTVTTTNDGSDANLADGVCDDGTGECTLRAAIEEGNSTGGSTEITLPAGAYGLSVGQVQSYSRGFETASVGVAGDISIVGAGRAATTIQYDTALSNFGTFHLLAGANLSLTSLTLTKTAASSRSDGIVINNDNASVVVTDVLFDDLRGTGIAAWDAAGNPEPANVDIRVFDSTFEGYNDSYNYSILLDGGGGATVEVANTLFNDMGYALLVVGNDTTANMLRVTDSTFTNSSGDPQSGAFEIYSGFDAEIIRTTVTNHRGGINQDGGGTLAIRDSVFTDNLWYGVVADGAETVVENSTFVDNGQFALDVDGGPLHVSGSAISGHDDGIHADFSDSTPDTITNTTISGVAYTAVSLTAGSVLRNVTITGNGLDDGGGAYEAVLTSSPISMYNTVVAGNGVDCDGGSVTSVNSADGDGSCGLTGPNDLSGIDPMLGPLADNGGPTFTHAPLPGSPLIDAGSNAECAATDQRGAIRPFDGDGDASAVCDIGAVELGAVVGAPETLSWSSDVVRRGMLRPDGVFNIEMQAEPGGTAVAQLDAKSWYPNGDTTQPISATLLDVTLAVPLTESVPGTYIGSHPLEGIAQLSRVAAHLDDGGAGVDLETTERLPVTVAGGLLLETAIPLPNWMVPTPRATVNSAIESDGDAIVVPLTGSTPTRLLEPGTDYIVRLGDADYRDIVTPVADIEVRGGLITPLVLPTDAAAHIPLAAVIQDSNGAPLPGTKVSVTDLATGDEVAQSVTGPDGRIEAVVRGNSARVSVDPLLEPYLPTEQDFVLTALDEELIINLGAGLPTSIVSGVVSHPLRPTVAGVRVTFETQIGDRLFTTSTMSGEDGAYSAEVFQGAVSIEVDVPYVGRATEAIVLADDVVVDLLLAGPLMIDLDIDLQARFAGEALASSVDIDRAVAAHYGLRLTSASTRLYATSNSVQFPLYAGDVIEFCADGYEAGLPAGCAEAVVDLAAGTATVALLLEQQGLVSGIMRWDVPGFNEYEPILTVSLARIEADGRLTLVWSDQPSAPETFVSGSFTQLPFAIPTPGPGEYVLGFGVEHYYTSQDGRRRFDHADGHRLQLTMPVNGVVDVGVQEVPHLSLPRPKFAYSPHSSLSLSPGDAMPGEVVRIRLAAHNSSDEAAADTRLRLDFPTGTLPVDGSVLVDGEPVTFTFVDGVLEVAVGTVAPEQVLVLTAWAQVAADFPSGGLLVSASVAHGVRTESLDAVIGVVRQLTINAARSTSSLDVPVWGRAVPGADVEVRVDGSSAATATASTGGVWRTTLRLPDVPLPRSFALTATAAGIAGDVVSPVIKVAYDPEAPTLIGARFHQTGGRLVEIDPAEGVAEFPFVWVPTQQTIVELEFDHPDRVEDVVVWVGEASAPAGNLTTELWQAWLEPRADQLGDVRANWTTAPAPLNLAPDPPQAVLTTKEARAMLPPGLAAFADLQVLESGPNGSTVAVDLPDLDAVLELSATTEPVSYDPTQADIERQADLGAPVWGFSTEEVTEPDGHTSLTTSLVIPNTALGQLAQPAGGRLIEAAAVSTLLKVNISFKPRGVPSPDLEALFNLVTGVGGDALGARFADEYIIELDRLGQLADAKCASSFVALYREQLDALSYMYMASLALASGLMIVGVVAGPETLGLGTLAAWGITEIVNRVVAKQLERETKRIGREINQNCVPEPEPPPPPPCAPEWNLVPAAMGGPDCHKIADPTYIHDPSGYVYGVVDDNRLEGVVATLQSAAAPGGPWSVWDAEWFGQSNPMPTDVDGRYGWDVPEGWWRVRYELDGYETAYSDVLQVLPPHFDVNVGLRNLAVPAVDQVDSVPGTTYIDVMFDQWMDVASLATERIELSGAGGAPVGFVVSYPDERTSAAGDQVAHTLRLDLGRPLVGDESFELELDRMIRSAGEIPLGAELVLDIVTTKLSQSIDLGAMAGRTYGDAPFAVSATATSGLPVSFSASGPCTAAAGVVTITGSGSCKVTASQAGDQQWLAAANVSTTFEVARAPLTVTAAATAGAVGSPPPVLTATATGLVNGDTLASLGGVSCTTDAPIAGGALSTAGMYLISCSGPSTTKYDVTHAGAALTVSGGAGPAAVPLPPARLLETRPGERTIDREFEGIGARAAKSVTKVRIAGRGGVPADASAAMVNLTIVTPDAPGYATIYPCTASPPNASNINYQTAGMVIANGVVAKLDANGDVCIFTLAASHILIDVNGYVPKDAGIGTVPPARLLETRPGEQTVDGQLEGIGQRPAMSVTKVRIAGRGDVPAGATAAMVNLTIVTPDGLGYATVYPCTATPPNASNINYQPGVVVANSAVAKLDANGDLCVFTLAATHILIDVGGYSMAESGVGTLPPARLLETRPGLETVDHQFEGIGQRAPQSVTKVRIAGRGGVPAGATAAMLNLTIVTPDGLGFATVYPCTTSPPNASNINYTRALVVANGVVAKLDANGDVCVYTLAASHVLIDVNGYLTS